MYTSGNVNTVIYLSICKYIFLKFYFGGKTKVLRLSILEYCSLLSKLNVPMSNLA